MSKGDRSSHAERRSRWILAILGFLMIASGATWIVGLADLVRRGHGIVPYLDAWGRSRFPLVELATIALIPVILIVSGVGAYLYERALRRKWSSKRRLRPGLPLGAPDRGVASPWRRGLSRLLGSLAEHGTSRYRRGGPLSTPFPDAWRSLLAKRSSHYRRLPEAIRQEFELQVQDFLGERRISGVEIDVTEEIKVLVAVSAATISTGWTGFRWGQVSEVLLYPQVFNADDYGFATADTAGQAHPWGIVILSIPTLLASFDHPARGYHVGIHEFAHVLDLESGDFDGVPLGLGRHRIRSWERLRAREERRLRRDDSELRSYALTNRVEFLAVAAETFFQKPVGLRQSSPALYALLRGYFQQDPAAWESGTPTRSPHARTPQSPGRRGPRDRGT